MKNNLTAFRKPADNEDGVSVAAIMIVMLALVLGPIVALHIALSSFEPRITHAAPVKPGPAEASAAARVRS